MNSFFNITFLLNKSRIILKMILLFLFLNLPVCVFAQGSLEGKVIDEETNSIISLANIKINRQDTKEYLQTQSEISGIYKFKNLESGLYEISVTCMGYENYSNKIMIDAGKTKSLNIFLKIAEIEIDKINVTSTKTEVTLQQTPSSISIVTADEIRKKNIQTFDNVLEQVQGVTLNRSSGINVNSLSIRGSSDVAGGGIGNRVLLLLDGRPSLTGDSKGALWSLIPVSIIERTEVVKGAFSSLYGSSAIGGVVNVITKKPTYNSFTGINFNYGFYQKLSDSLRFTNNLLTFTSADIIHSNTIKKFSYLLNLNYNNNDGHSQQTNYDFYSGIGKFTFDVFGNRDLEVTLQYTNSNSGFPHYWRKQAGSVADPYKIAEYYLGDKIKKETKSFDLFYRAIPNAKSKYTTRFYYYSLNSNSYYNPNNPVSIEFADTGKGLNTFIDSYNIGNISQVDFQLGKDNYLVSGVDFQMNIVKSEPQEILYGDQQMNNIGIFAQDQFKIIKDKFGNSELEATLGARVDLNKVVSGIKSTELSPKFSVVYSPVTSNDVIKNTAYRFLVGRAFRAPSIAEIYFKKELFGGFDFLYNPSLKPEQMISAEVGVRKQFTNRFTLDMAFFFNRYQNLIQYVNTGTSIYGPFQVQNIADSQIKGFEFSIDYNSKLKIGSNPFEYFFNISYTYLNARDLSANRKDDYLPYKPVNNFLFTTNFTYYGFNLDINGKYLSAIDEVLFYKLEEPEAYFLLGMKISKEITKKMSFFIGINNLFDVSYQELERIQAPNRNFNSGFNLEF
jgi:iron complex outermembrane receptor protein